MSKFAVKLSLYKDLNMKIIYKLHPGEYYQWEKRYPWLNNPIISVIDSDQISLYELFAKSKYQIGVYSTSIYEGLTFNLKTYLLDLPGVEYMDYLIENNYVKLIKDIDDFVLNIKNNDCYFNQNTEIFFKRNSLDNILKTLNTLIN